MSSSVFKEYSTPNNNGKIDTNLVILVNKFGNVSVDQTALHNLLDNDAPNTSISVVRIASPTPSLQLELDEEEEKKSKYSDEMNNSKIKNDNNESEDDEDEENEESDENENENDDEEDELEMNEKNHNDMENDEDENKSVIKRNIGNKKKRKNKKNIDKAPHVSLTIENYFPPDEAKLFAAEILSYAGVTSALSIKTQYDYHRYVVENDHCYTPLTSPSQRINNSRINSSIPGSRESVKSGGRFKTSKGSPIHQNVNSNKSQQATKLNHSEKEQSKDDMDISEDNNSETYQLQNLLDDNESDLSELSISDNDRDSDSDYHIHGPRGSRKPRRIVKGHRNSLIQNNKQTKIIRKRQSISSSSHDKDMENSLFDLENSDGGSSTLNSDTREDSNVSKNRKRGKTPKKHPNNNSGQTATSISNNELKSIRPAQSRSVTQSSPVTPIATSTPAGSSKQSQKIKSAISTVPADIQNVKQLVTNKVETVKMNTINSKASHVAAVSAPAPVQNSVQQAAQKKDKKPPAHVEALFSDMISLFSTPDIIKKVGTDEPIQKPQNQNSPISTVKGFMQLNPTKNKDNLPSQISIQTHSSAAELASEQDKQLDLIDSIVQQEMIQQNLLTDRQMYDDIPNIVKMLENPVVDTAMLNNVIGIAKDPIGGATVVKNHLVNDMTNITNPTTQIPTNDDNSSISISHNLLDSLNNPEDGLTEDLLQHVAELVENKNLQEIIDTQVLGVQNIVNTNQMQSIAAPLLTSSPIIKEKESPFVKLAAMKAASKEAAAANANRKDPVQIVRSDGRVITLPPIEAPATRGAKRRAQNQPSPSQQIQSQISLSKIQNTQNELISNVIDDNKIMLSSPVQAKPVKKGHRNSSNSNESLSKDISSIRSVTNSSSTISNISSSGINNINNSKRVNPAGTVSTPESEDNMESDESWNSEDDPDRLWCICKQPHNNRFMICCDSCEDWFHGKCVNITKLMGQEMEESGIEWTCPNCIKKTQQNPIKKLQRDDSRGSTPTNSSTTGTSTPTMTINRNKIIRNHTMDEFITTNTLQGIISVPQTTTTSSSSIIINTANEKNNKINLTTLSTSCIVCKKSSTRANSIYCSDECIRRHAVNALVTTKTTSTIVDTNFVNNATLNDCTDSTINSDKSHDEKKKLSTIQNQQQQQQSDDKQEPVQSKRIGLLKNKNDRVIVFERKTGRCLAGNSAPTMDNLKQWLNDNPTFEVVQPGSTQAKAIRMKQMQIRKLAKDTETTVGDNVDSEIKSSSSSPGQQKIQSKLQISSLKQIVYVNPKTISGTGPVGAQPQILPKNNNLKASSSPKEIANTKPTGNTLVMNTSTPTTTPVKNQKINDMRSRNDRNEAEPIRVNVKRTLKEQLSSRMQEVTDETISKMTEEEIENFATDTESEMYLLFNKDTGVKYRAKYRSLMFNIKDRKNLTLFRKICDKVIEPKQLVRLSPEELASQELAKWREQENKHQLEMIKKSELDLLACAKNYVLKTHKGEEVIENRIIERGDDEDVVSLLNNNINNESVSSTTETQMHVNHKQLHSLSHDAIYSKKDKHDSGQHYQNHHHSHSSSSSSSTSKNGGHSSTNKKKDHHRSRSKSHDRHDHSGSSKSGKHKSSSRKHSRDRKSKSRDRDSKQSNKDKQSSRDHRDKKDKNDSKIHNKSNNVKESPSKINQKPQEVTNKKVIKKVVKKEEDYNLIDKILEASSSSLLDKMLYPDEQNSAKKKSVKQSAVQSTPEIIKKSISIESDQEPSSTVTIPTPPENTYDADMIGDYNDSQSYIIEDNYQHQKSFEIVWNGNINMVDVATFKICAQAVSGYCTEIKNDLPVLLDVVGRISPETVWDYISKIKKSPNKEILILRLATIDDAESYNALYSYLNTRKRLGVIKTASPYVKDFYLLPLAAHKSLPSILLPLHGPGFIEGDNRPDLLLGIVVKIRNKRSAGSQFMSNIPTKIRKSSPQLSGTFTPPSTEERYTPPNSPKALLNKSKHAKSNKSKLTIGLPKNINSASNIVASSRAADDDEPYSPGGSDDIDYDTIQTDLKHNNLILNTGVNDLNLSANSNPGGLDQDDIARKMEELTREIEAQKMEIALLHKGQESLDEPYSPSRPVSTSPPNTIAKAPAAAIPTLANISIPSNLQEILASIKNVSSNAAIFNVGQTAPPPPKIGSIGNIFNNSNDDEEYTPTPVTPSCYYNNSNIEYVPKRQNEVVPVETNDSSIYNAMDTSLPLELPKYDIDDRILPPIINTPSTPSKLAQLSEAELLSMVPDDIDLDENKKQNEPLNKKTKWDKEPPPPGLEDEYDE